MKDVQWRLQDTRIDDRIASMAASGRDVLRNCE
jgi:hypothetical protein